jgi:hypothetical protein
MSDACERIIGASDARERIIGAMSTTSVSEEAA